ncbi:MerR family transcriptional regulator [Ktedonosporobacter rubrisoli]|uniref:MerR family transcriptional regulator n=1 Tax=Ktedonosporobacter rubrisoli TaxID=2509675 RepID=A0A4V0Z045_KTERU|nr:MerR family transcriptional regulator [Ktedonosporobacter rubrisoli]QBD81941.1 MerR family transcriptional regulator [Ktedonosporobacter rubrisoli]
MKKILRPVDLAQATGLSVQSIRNYERYGFIPPAERGPQGYRLYTAHHLHALRISRTIIASYGWARARLIMSTLHRHDLPAALALIDAYHAEIHGNRCHIEETLRALRTTSITIAPLFATEDAAKLKLLNERQGLLIREAARRVDVRVSALRFWEEQGLLHPARDRTSGYRFYDAEQMRNLQVIVLLRKAGYNFEAIRAILAQLAAGTPEQALQAAEKRLQELAEMSRRCLEALAELWAYIKTL